MKKFNVLFLLAFTLVLTNCTKEEEPTITDISVVSSENSISWVSNNDLTEKLNNALTYNYGDALESEIEKTLTFNPDSTKVAATIDFKTDFQDKYSDSNQDNNSVEISLEKINPIIGKWKKIKVVTKCSANDETVKEYSACKQNGSITFKSDGSYIDIPYVEYDNECIIDGESNGTWEFINDELYITPSDETTALKVTFLEIDKNSLKLGVDSDPCDGESLPSVEYLEYIKIE